MTDELPPLRVTRRPGSAPRPEVLAAVVGEGRRRLRRGAMWSAGTVMAVVGVLTLGFGGTGNEALLLIPASPAPGVVTRTTAVPATPPAPSPSTGSGTTTAAGPGPVVPLGPPTARGGEPAAQTGATPAPTPAGPLPAYRENPTSTGGNAELCRGVVLRDTPSGYRVCIEMNSSTGTSTASGTPTTISINLCNSLASPDAFSLSFSGGREHDVIVHPVRSVEDLWTWSLHHDFPQGAHRRSVLPGDCLSWRTEWDTRDDAGGRVRPGDYDVEGNLEINGRTQKIHYPLAVT